MRSHRKGVGGAWRLGLRYGVLCLGSCWALMLVMFGLGVGSVVSMPLGKFLKHLSTGYGDQQGNPVFIMEDSSMGSIRVRTHLVDEDTNMGWQPSGFVQQVRSRTRVGSSQSFQELPQCDVGSIKR